MEQRSIMEQRVYDEDAKAGDIVFEVVRFHNTKKLNLSMTKIISIDETVTPKKQHRKILGFNVEACNYVFTKTNSKLGTWKSLGVVFRDPVAAVMYSLSEVMRVGKNSSDKSAEERLLEAIFGYNEKSASIAISSLPYVIADLVELNTMLLKAMSIRNQMILDKNMHLADILAIIRGKPEEKPEQKPEES